MDQKIVITLTDWSEEDKQGEVGDEGEQRLSHCSSMVGDSEQAKRQLKEVLTNHGYEICRMQNCSSGDLRQTTNFGH
jgi:hypothetical protein